MELHRQDMAASRPGDVEQTAGAEEEFGWTGFYMEMADKLLRFRKRRGELIKGIHKIASDVDCGTLLLLWEKRVPSMSKNAAFILIVYLRIHPAH